MFSAILNNVILKRVAYFGVTFYFDGRSLTVSTNTLIHLNWSANGIGPSKIQLKKLLLSVEIHHEHKNAFLAQTSPIFHDAEPCKLLSTDQATDIL